MILFFRSIMCCALICSGMGSAFAQNRFNVYTPDADKFPKVRAFYEAADLNNVPIPGISSTDFGLNLGAGFNITDDLSIKLNYGLGMADLNDDASSTYYLKNNVSSVGIAYTFKK